MVQYSFNGAVGIGTTSPNPDYKLNVNGKVRAQEIKVETANWPDYVFKPNYQLPTLEEIEKYIKEKGYLPDMPSALEAESKGIDLGEMNKMLLKKVEELTLHLIDKDKALAKEIELNKLQSLKIYEIEKKILDMNKIFNKIINK